MALADGDLLSSFVAEKTKLECRRLQQRVPWGAEKKHNSPLQCVIWWGATILPPQLRWHCWQ